MSSNGYRFVEAPTQFARHLPPEGEDALVDRITSCGQHTGHTAVYRRFPESSDSEYYSGGFGGVGLATYGDYSRGFVKTR